MKRLILPLLFLVTFFVYADTKISQLPLGTANTTVAGDSFPYVDSIGGVTRRLTLYDIINIPAVSSTYAPLSSPTFTGIVTAPQFTGNLVGNVTGNASTASALSSTLLISGGGTGQTTQQAAIDALVGSQSSGQYLRSNGTHVSMSSIQAGDVPTLNQNTTGTAGGLSITLPILQGGTGQTTQQSAINALLNNSVTAGTFARADGTNISMSSIQNADLPTSGVTAGSYTNANITVNSQGLITSAANGSSAGVTSVGLALPVSVFSVSGSPVTSTGTLTGSFTTQSANTVFSGPTTGAATTPTFRSLVSADIPWTVVNSNITPLSDNAVTLGGISNRWSNIYGTIIEAGAGTSPIFLQQGRASGGVFPYSLGTYDTISDSTVTPANPLIIQTANGSGTGTSQAIGLYTGTNSSTGNSGNIQLVTGSIVSGSRGKIQIQDGTQGVVGAILGSVDTSGSGSWSTSLSSAVMSNITQLGTITSGIWKGTTIGLGNFTQFTTGAGTFTTSANSSTNTQYKITLIGGGGGGGGAGVTNEQGTGGGAGDVCVIYISGIAASTGLSYSVGTGGPGGGASGGTGTSGGSTTITIGVTTYTAGGGTGGVGTTTGTNQAGGVGGTGTNCTYDVPGEQGGPSMGAVAGNPSGKGGSSMGWGFGGASLTGSTGAVGNTGTGHGSGGGGANSSGPNRAGGAGTGGGINIEYSN